MGMSTEGEVMDASGAPVTDELTGVHRGPGRDAIYEPEKTARRKAHDAAGLLRRLNASRTSAQLYLTQQELSPRGGRGLRLPQTQAVDAVSVLLRY